MKKLTNGEISYILGLKKKKFDWVLDWMLEGTLEEINDGHSYHLTIYLKKPVYYIVRPLLTPFVFIYLVLEGGVKEAKEELKIQSGRDIGHFYLHEEKYEKAKFINWLKKEEE